MCSDILQCYILSARLHLHAFYLLDDPSSPGYVERIIMLYNSASRLTRHTIDADNQSDAILAYCPFFLYQSIVCASLILAKVLKSDYFSLIIDIDGGTKLFNASLNAIRKISVANNDLPGRLVDVLAFLWTQADSHVLCDDGIEGLRLKVRSRRSVSVVYDSLWRWRDQFHRDRNPASDTHDDGIYISIDEAVLC